MTSRESDRARTRWPWLVWAAVIALLAATAVLSLLNGESVQYLWTLLPGLLGYTTVGALLASRAPGNAIGWLLMFVGFTLSLSSALFGYATYTLVTRPGELVGGTVAGAIAPALWGLMLTTLPLIALLFPTGRVPTRRWRHVPSVIVAAGVALMVGVIFGTERLLDAPRFTNPMHVPVLEVLSAVGIVALIVATAASIAALVLRYRRARGEERQQIRWLAYIVLAASTLFLLAIGLSLAFGESALGSVTSEVGITLLGIGVPVAIGIAILKYHLYDLDLVIKKTVAFGVVAGGITLVTFAVLLAVPVGLFGSGLSGWEFGLLALGIAIGLLIGPLRRVAGRIADRLVYGGRARPYEILTEFSRRVADSYSTEDVLPRMSQIVAGGAGAASATVWLRVGSELRPLATWPEGDTRSAYMLSGDGLPTLPERETAVGVRHQGELLGAISVITTPSDPMNPSKERLIRDLASQAGLVLRNVRLIEELRGSRRRIVAAQDQGRRRLERDIHDGAQQQLVALAVKLRLADQAIDRDPLKAHGLMAQLQTETHDALENLRDLARGIYPPLLADKGLVAALETQARKTPLPVTIEPEGIGRYTPEIEATVYFCVLEALQNIVKYAEASCVSVALLQADGALTFEVRDDGVGFDPASAQLGTGLQGMSDRLEAIGGAIEIGSAPGSGTKLIGRIPLGS